MRAKRDPSAANLASQVEEKNRLVKRAMDEYMDLERVVIALARRQGGVLVFSEAELTHLPPRSSVVQVHYPDGRTEIRVVSDEHAEPGSGG